MLKNMLENVRKNCPLVHNITNYVTVNDCANIILACGASPIMADDENEVEEITTICGGLNINIGTLNKRTIASMLKAGKKANELNHPVVLDPVGAGASALRTETATKLLEEVKFSVIRGNISEIKTLALGSGTTKGVDADVADKVTEENLDEVIAFAKAFSAKTGAVIAITGASNAYNLTDGLDGLASGVTALVSIFMVVAGTAFFFTGEPIVFGAVAGGCLGFLMFNKNPAKIFMGDTGSLFLGGAISVVAVGLGMPLILIICGFVYLFETLSVILQVASFKLTGKRIFKMSPIHHHFEMCGWREVKIVSVFTLVTLALCIISILAIMPVCGL